ncbi:MAG: thiamine-phosphate kinase [Acidobacteriota bacterium]|nr:thiamine-phosphate kinase [Acidobacteriota bacterium]
MKFSVKSEFDFIEAVRRRSSPSKIGDDCAVLPKDSKTDLVITTDLLVEDIDFRLDWTTPEFLGHKALAVSLSDVAAMGAKPVWAMLSIGIPENIWKTDFVEKFYDGWFALAKKFDVELVGGDVSKTPDKIVVDSIAAGEVKKGKAILRSNAQIGDLIFVTGALGGAAAGLQLFEKGARYDQSKHKNLLLRQLKPDPQTETGKILGSKNLATAMIDVSDGLASDLNHVCRESQVGAEIFADKIPDLFDSEKFSSVFNSSEIKNFVLNGGEDYELLFTVSPKKKIRVEKELAKSEFSLIGKVTTNVEIIELNLGNKIEILEPKGFRHF